MNDKKVLQLLNQMFDDDNYIKRNPNNLQTQHEDHIQIATFQPIHINNNVERETSLQENKKSNVPDTFANDEYIRILKDMIMGKRRQINQGMFLFLSLTVFLQFLVFLYALILPNPILIISIPVFILINFIVSRKMDHSKLWFGKNIDFFSWIQSLLFKQKLHHLSKCEEELERKMNEVK